jgi:peptidoglycan hydrolase CwlO-like protein
MVTLSIKNRLPSYILLVMLTTLIIYSTVVLVVHVDQTSYKSGVIICIVMATAMLLIERFRFTQLVDSGKNNTSSDLDACKKEVENLEKKIKELNDIPQPIYSKPIYPPPEEQLEEQLEEQPTNVINNILDDKLKETKSNIIENQSENNIETLSYPDIPEPEPKD